MSKTITFVGLASQNGDDLPEVTEITNTGFCFDVEQEMDNQDPPQAVPGEFFFVKRGFFALGKCALIFQQSENGQSVPCDIIVDHNYAEPDKIKFIVQNRQTGDAENGILNNTPFQLTVNVGC